MSINLPSSAAVVVVGGGVMGASIAYHLAAAGITDVLVIEKNTLASGSTGKAAGGVRASFSHPTNIAMGLRGLDVYSRFLELFGRDIDFSRNGYLFALGDQHNVDVFTESVAIQNTYGVPSQMIDPDEAQRISPLITTDGLLAAAWSPIDGRASPDPVVHGYANAGRSLGVRFVEGCAVEGIETAGSSIVAVVTSHGRVKTTQVVCAAGAWSKQIGDMVGIDLPVSPVRRQIAFTAPSPLVPRNSPLTIDFPSTFYFHPEGGGLIYGWADPDQSVGFNLEFDLEGWLPKFAHVVERRTPKILEMGIASGWAGLYETTPDDNQIIGRGRGIDGFFYATGFSGHGFLMGPAVGEIVRDLVLGHEPGYDISAFDVSRFDNYESGRQEHNIV